MRKNFPFDVAAVCLGGFAFAAYASYLLKLLIWPETLQAVVICFAVMALTAIPIAFHKKIAKLLPAGLFLGLKIAYLICGAFYAVSFAAMCIYISTVNSNQVLPDELSEETVFIVYGAGLEGEKPGKALQKRLDKAVQLGGNLKDAYYIVSGGQGDNEVRTEASAMKEYLVLQGIREDRIIEEDQARNTIQNIQYSFEIINEMGLEEHTAVSVSNAFHIPRIIMLCERYGESTLPALADNPDPRFIFATLVREYMSYTKLILFGGE